MPELPEVETVRAGLERLLIGKRILGQEHNWPKGFPNAPADVKAYLIGAVVTAVRRRGKVLLIELDTGYSLVTHLKMTGQLVYVPQSNVKSQMSDVTNERFGAGHPNDSLIGQLPDRSTRVSLDLGMAKLFFNDQRKFGWMKLIPTIEVPEIDFFKKLGPEPLSDDLTASDFVGRFKRRPGTSIKTALLDQSVVAGVGNIYADEALFAARIHPTTLVKDVPAAKLVELFGALRAVLRLSIEKGGSTDRNYVDAEGNRGSYLTFARVFRRNGQPCVVCGTAIVKLRVAGRGTHVCPNCQPVPE